MTNPAKKVVLMAMRGKAEERLTELRNFLHGMFILVRGLGIDSTEVEGGSYGKLCFDKDNCCDYYVDDDAVDGPVGREMEMRCCRLP